MSALPPEIEALHQRFQRGDRVRAAVEIVYPRGGPVPAGTFGYVLEQKDSPIVIVVWDLLYRKVGGGMTRVGGATIVSELERVPS